MATGLLSNDVRSVVQDKTGYLWIATNNGLQRYDGVHFKTFQHHDNQPGSLPGNFLIQLLIDREDNLWILFSDGQVGRFDKNNFHYTPATTKVQRPNSLWAVKSLVSDTEGNLFYFLEGAELLGYDRQKNEFSAAASFIPVQKGWLVTGFVQQPGTSKYWLGLQSGGIAVFNRQTGRLSYTGHNVEAEAAVDSLQKLPSPSHFLFDKKGRFWMDSWPAGHYPHVFLLDRQGRRTRVQRFEFLTKLKSYNEVHGFFEQENGRVWVRGNILLGYFNEAAEDWELVPSDARSGLGIYYDHITAMYEDREHNVWTTTGNYGMYRFNTSQQYFTNIMHINQETGAPGSGSVLSFLQTKNKNILVGTWGDGLFYYTPDFKEIPLKASFPAKRPTVAFWSMVASADSNTIWIGCQPGVYEYNQAKGSFVHHVLPSLERRTIRKVAEDKQGNLWLGTHHAGLYKWMAPKSGKKDFLTQIPEIGYDLVTSLQADAKGFVWVTTERKGVYAFESETGQIRFHWNNRADNDSTRITEGFSDLLLYNDTTVYFASASRLYRFNRRTDLLDSVRLPAPLLGTIAALQKDSEENLWISTSNGLYRYHPDKKVLLFFNRQDGIASDRFVVSAAHRLPDGRMLFGADNAFVYFDPGRISFSDSGRKVVLTSILAGKKEMRVDSVLQLPYLNLAAGDNSLSLEFSSLSFASNTPIQYMLEGIDKDWQNAGKDNKASFPFLPPGRYTLLLRTISSEGQPSAVSTLSIRVQSPFFQTWWFYSLLAAVFASLLFWLDRQRSKRKSAMEKVRTDIADGLHQEVNTALNNINILSEIARLKSEREPQRAKEYLEQIHTKSHNMIIALDDMLWSLDPENDAMYKTINRIREFADSLMQRSGASIELLIDKKVEGLQLNMKLRHEAFLLFKEGLRSLIDAGTEYCIVHLTAERGKLLFTIEFENEHCNMQKLNNLLQRRDMEERIEALNARLHVDLHKSRSVFMLQLPLEH